MKGDVIKTTVYLDQELNGALALYSVFENKDKSEAIRELLRKAIPQRYFELWDKNINRC